MRALRYIVRFLGISFIILWLLASFVRADDNVTVNFPDQMSVSGSVEITNLGITGDPQPNYEAFTPLDGGDYRDAAINENSNNISSTYIDSFETVTFLRLGTGSYLDGESLFTFKIPKFKWANLKEDFAQSLFGSNLGTDPTIPTGQKLFPSFLGGRSNLESGRQLSGQTVVTDQIGNGTWQMNFDWAYLNGSSLPSPAGGYDLSAWRPAAIKPLLNLFVSFVAWFECFYLIFGKVSMA
ncbi:MAG: hypothetical protein IJH67_03525 [Thermoguttaceae bacterium]|nr:hypothetical protein [Thermoguttaceae bacterium]